MHVSTRDEGTSTRVEALFHGGVLREIPLPGSSPGDPTHDMVMHRDLTGNASQVSSHVETCKSAFLSSWKSSVRLPVELI